MMCKKPYHEQLKEIKRKRLLKKWDKPRPDE